MTYETIGVSLGVLFIGLVLALLIAGVGRILPPDTEWNDNNKE